MPMEAAVGTKQLKAKLKDKAIGATAGISGAASILGSWQICHNVCLGVIALLGLIGITITGMPLFFLTQIAVPIWAFAVVLLTISFALYVKMKCISRNLLIINTGLIVAGTPFAPDKAAVFWTLGGGIVLAGIILWIKGRWKPSGGTCHE